MIIFWIVIFFEFIFSCYFAVSCLLHSCLFFFSSQTNEYRFKDFDSRTKRKVIQHNENKKHWCMFVFLNMFVIFLMFVYFSSGLHIS